MKNVDKKFKELVMQLRQETGAGKIDCQKALINCDNSIEKSIQWIIDNNLQAYGKL